MMPARIGVIQFDVYDRNSGNVIGTVNVNVGADIQPYETTSLELNLWLDPNTAGQFISGLFNTFKLDLIIQNFQYNGVTLLSDISIPEVDLSSMIASLLSGLNLGSLTGSSGSSLQPNVASTIRAVDREFGIPTQASGSSSAQSSEQNQAASQAWNLDTQSSNYQSQSVPSSAQTTTSSSSAPSFAILNLGVGENSKEMAVSIDAAIATPALTGFDFGNIYIKSLDAGLYGPNGPGATTQSQYTQQIARLSTLTPGVDNITYNLSGVSGLTGYYRNSSYPIQVNLGQESFLGARLELFKDNITGPVHPSSIPADCNFSDPDSSAPNSIVNFIGANSSTGGEYKYPTWFFLYNLLAQQSINCAIRLNELSVNIFGIPIDNISIPANLIPPLNLQHLFNLQSLLSSAALQPTGFFGTIAVFVQAAGLSGLGIPLPKAASSQYPDQNVNLDALSGLLGNINTDQLLSSIHENIGHNLTLD